MPAVPELVELLSRSWATLIFTGAGISTASGIPDFRGPQGVWQRRQPVYYDDFMSRRAARVEYWDYKLEGWPAFSQARPNAVHHSIFRLEEAGRLAMVVTQNTDGLHLKAGTSEGRLVELHGSNARVACQSCGVESDPEPHMVSFAATREPPRCGCGGYLKQTTISFGQSLQAADLDRASRAAAEADLVVALGTTLSVYPAASIPLEAAARGVPYVIINRGATDHDGHPGVTLRLEGDVGALFPPAVATLVEPGSPGSQSTPG